MAIVRTYRCDVCGNEETVFHLSASEPAPEECWKCAHAGPKAIPSAPHIAKSIGKTADAVQRNLEDSTNANRKAAEEFGNEEQTRMAIREFREQSGGPGDIPANLRGGFGGAVGSSGTVAQDYSAYTGAVRSGPFPNAGARFGMSTIQTDHRQRVAAVLAEGQRG